MKFLHIQKSLTSAENVVLTIINRREGATLLNCDEETTIEVRMTDLFGMPDGYQLVDISVLDELEESAGWRADTLDAYEISYGTIQGL